MKKFIDEFPQAFFGSIFMSIIICIAIFIKFFGNQNVQVDIESQGVTEAKQINDSQLRDKLLLIAAREKSAKENKRRIEEQKEVSRKKQEEAVRKNRERQFAIENDPSYNIHFNERFADFLEFRLKTNRGVNPNSSIEKLPAMQINFSVIYKDDEPYGTNVSVVYSKFYESYYVKFLNEDRYEVNIKLKDKNFNFYGIKEVKWSFKYNGSIYKMKGKNYYFSTQ